MRSLALLMAGGRGERMRASGVAAPKPLVRVAGATLLERNLFLLLGAGFTDVVVSVPASSPEIGEFAASRCRSLAAAVGGTVSLLEEEVPLGNIGCAGRLLGRSSTVLVVYADNVTTLDLRAVFDHHTSSEVALTLAAHEYEYQLPYGELRVERGMVVEYREKPRWRPLVCSAVCVLGPAALEATAGLTVGDVARQAGLVDLFRALYQSGEHIAAFTHGAPWVDVNDADAVGTAEELVAAHASTFERWSPEPPRQVDRTIVLGTGPDCTVVLDDVDNDEVVRYRINIKCSEEPAGQVPDIVPTALRRALWHAGHAKQPG